MSSSRPGTSVSLGQLTQQQVEAVAYDGQLLLVARQIGSLARLAGKLLPETSFLLALALQLLQVRAQVKAVAH